MSHKFNWMNLAIVLIVGMMIGMVVSITLKSLGTHFLVNILACFFSGGFWGWLSSKFLPCSRWV